MGRTNGRLTMLIRVLHRKPRRSGLLVLSHLRHTLVLQRGIFSTFHFTLPIFEVPPWRKGETSREVEKEKKENKREIVGKCHHCSTEGHWKRNCPLYIVEIGKNKKNAGNVPKNSWYPKIIFEDNYSWAYFYSCCRIDLEEHDGVGELAEQCRIQARIIEKLMLQLKI